MAAHHKPAVVRRSYRIVGPEKKVVHFDCMKQTQEARDPRNGSFEPNIPAAFLLPRNAPGIMLERKPVSGVVLVGVDASLDHADLVRNANIHLAFKLCEADVPQHAHLGKALRIARLPLHRLEQATTVAKGLHGKKLGNSTVGAFVDYGDSFYDYLERVVSSEYMRRSLGGTLEESDEGPDVPFLSPYRPRSPPIRRQEDQRRIERGHGHARDMDARHPTNGAERHGSSRDHERREDHVRPTKDDRHYESDRDRDSSRDRNDDRRHGRDRDRDRDRERDRIRDKERERDRSRDRERHHMRHDDSEEDDWRRGRAHRSGSPSPRRSHRSSKLSPQQHDPSRGRDSSRPRDRVTSGERRGDASDMRSPGRSPVPSRHRMQDQRTRSPQRYDDKRSHHRGDGRRPDNTKSDRKHDSRRDAEYARNTSTYASAYCPPVRPTPPRPPPPDLQASRDRATPKSLLDTVVELVWADLFSNMRRRIYREVVEPTLQMASASTFQEAKEKAERVARAKQEAAQSVDLDSIFSIKIQQAASRSSINRARAKQKKHKQQEGGSVPESVTDDGKRSKKQAHGLKDVRQRHHDADEDDSPTGQSIEISDNDDDHVLVSETSDSLHNMTAPRRKRRQPVSRFENADEEEEDSRYGGDSALKHNQKQKHRQHQRQRQEDQEQQDNSSSDDDGFDADAALLQMFNKPAKASVTSSPALGHVSDTEKTADIKEDSGQPMSKKLKPSPESFKAVKAEAQEISVMNMDAGHHDAMHPSVAVDGVKPEVDEQQEQAEQAYSDAFGTSWCPLLSSSSAPEAKQRVLEMLACMSKEDVELVGMALEERKEEDYVMSTFATRYMLPMLRSAHRCVTDEQRPAHEEKQEHAQGCARAQGYYFIPSDKKREKLSAGRHGLAQKQRARAREATKEDSRESRRKARQLTGALSREGIDQAATELQRINQLKLRKKMLAFGRSRIHDWGLFAMEPIPKGDVVIEYVGECVRRTVADERERHYTAIDVGSSYLFQVDGEYIIDATRRGSIARFMNHSCEPNCWAQIISIGSSKRIVIYSAKDIELGEEITYDYKFPQEETNKIRCSCGAAKCRGFLI